MAEAVAKIIIVGQDQASGTFKKINESIEGIGKTAKKNQSYLDDFVGSLSPVSLKVTSGAAAGAAIAYIGTRALQAANQLDILNRRATAIFGSSFPKMTAESERLAAAVGRSGDDMLQLATDFAALEKSAGLSSNAIETMSTNLAHLTVDLASASGKSQAEVFEALRGGILGNARALRELNIIMDDNAVQTAANTKGMSEARQMVARYNFILDQTKGSQGDATRNAASFNNQLERLKGNWEDILQVVGKPVLAGTATVLGVIADIAKIAAASVNALASAFEKLNRVVPVGKAIGEGTSSLIGSFIPGFNSYRQVKSLTSSLSTGVGYGPALNPLTESNSGSVGVGGGGGDRAAESLKKIKEGMADLARTYNDKVKDVQRSLGDLAASHREKMSDFVKQMQNVRDEASRMADDYNKALGRMNDSEADSVVKQEELVRSLEERIARLRDQNEGFFNGKLVTSLGNRSKENVGKNLTYEEEKSFGLTGDQAELFNLVVQRDREKAALASYTPTPGANIDLAGARSRFFGSSFTTDIAGQREQRSELEESHQRDMDSLKERGEEIQKNMRKESLAYQTAREQYAQTIQSFEKFKSDYIRGLGEVGAASDDILSDLKQKLEDIRTTIASIDALMASRSDLTNGTLTQLVGQRRAERLGETAGSFLDIPKFASGGIVTKPTVALIGEAGPEAVVPLGKRSMAGNVTITIQNMTVAKEADVDEVMRRITRQIQLQQFQSS